VTAPGWWASGVRVTGQAGQAGSLERTGDGWLVALDNAGTESGSYVVQPEAAHWRPEVKQLLNSAQRDRIVHDCQRAFLRAFGCHYIPEWEGLPESVRVRPPSPKAVGRPELAALQALVRGAVSDALTPYTAP
jgi:hypothetical protein